MRVGRHQVSGEVSFCSPRRRLQRERAHRYNSEGGWPAGINDFDVLEDGKVVGRIFFLDALGPQGRPWMWASGHNGDIKRAAHGYEPTREAAMAVFAKSWRRE